MDSIWGASGVPGFGTITTLTDANEVHPAELVTVKVCVPGNKPGIIIPDPDPVMDPGLMVQFPDGKPPSSTLPVAISQVGWVIVTTTGAEGAPGCVLITILADAAEVHPEALVTV